MQDLNKIQISANEIMPGLFLGNYAASQSSKFIEKNKIRAVVNCSKDIPCKFMDITYLRIPIDDPGYGFAFTNDHKVFLESVVDAYRFISTHLESGKNVLVHCHAGMQRSASVVIYCLMHSAMHTQHHVPRVSGGAATEREKYNAVVAYVQSKRPIIYHYGQYNNFFPAFKRILKIQ
jgi:protein tyrosine phosphatase